MLSRKLENCPGNPVEAEAAAPGALGKPKPGGARDTGQDQDKVGAGNPLDSLGRSPEGHRDQID